MYVDIYYTKQCSILHGTTSMHIIRNYKILLIIVTITHLRMCSKKALRKWLAQGYTIDEAIMH